MSNLLVVLLPQLRLLALKDGAIRPMCLRYPIRQRLLASCIAVVTVQNARLYVQFRFLTNGADRPSVHPKVQGIHSPSPGQTHMDRVCAFVDES